MQPYYSENGIEIYHGRAEVVLPTLPPCDLLATDPPYGIGEARKNNASRGKLAVAKDYGRAEWDDAPPPRWMLEQAIDLCRHQIIFGGNYFGLAPSSCWLVWDKDNGECDFADVDEPEEGGSSPSLPLGGDASGARRRPQRAAIPPDAKAVGGNDVGHPAGTRRLQSDPRPVDGLRNDVTRRQGLGPTRHRHRTERTVLRDSSQASRAGRAVRRRRRGLTERQGRRDCPALLLGEGEKPDGWARHWGRLSGGGSDNLDGSGGIAWH